MKSNSVDEAWRSRVVATLHEILHIVVQLTEIAFQPPFAPSFSPTVVVLGKVYNCHAIPVSKNTFLIGGFVIKYYERIKRSSHLICV